MFGVRLPRELPGALKTCLLRLWAFLKDMAISGVLFFLLVCGGPAGHYSSIGHDCIYDVKIILSRNSSSSHLQSERPSLQLHKPDLY